VIDTQTNRVINTLSVGIHPIDAAFAPDGQFVYVLNAGPYHEEPGSVSVISTQNQQVVLSQISLGGTARRIAFTPVRTLADVNL